MFNDKLTKSVADAVRQCISEEQKETQVQLNESKYTETKDKQGKMKSWKYEGDWEDSKEKKEGRGKVTHMSDVARRASEKMKKDDENVKEEVELTESELEEMSGAGWSAQKVHGHLKKSGWTLARTGGGHDVFTHPKAKNHIAVPRHKGDLKAPLVQGILKTVKMTTEAVEQIDEISDKTLINYLTKVDDDSRKHKMDPTKRSPEKANKSVTGFSRAFNKLDSRKGSTNEEVELDEEQLDEISKETLGSYIRKASGDRASATRAAGVEAGARGPNRWARMDAKEKRAEKRGVGIDKAVTRLTKEELEEGLFPGTPEYEKKFGKVPQEMKQGQKKKTHQGEMEKTGKGVVHRRSFREMVELYQVEGVKGLFEEISVMQEESSEEEFNAELKKQKDKAEGKAPQADVAAAATQGTKEMKEEVEELDETPKVDRGLSGKQKVSARAARGDNDMGLGIGNTSGGQARHREFQNVNVAKSGERKGMITKAAIAKTKDEIKSRLNKEEVELSEGLLDAMKKGFATGMQSNLKKSIKPEHHGKYDFNSVKSVGDSISVLKKAKAAGHLVKEDTENLTEVTQGVEHSEWADNVKQSHPGVRIFKNRDEDGRHKTSHAMLNGKKVGQYNMKTGVGTFKKSKNFGEQVDLDERSLTSAETAEKERIVKGRFTPKKPQYVKNTAVVSPRPSSDSANVKLKEEDELNEVSNELLTRYKNAAGKDARESDKKGDFKRGDKRFGGIIKATIKQFDNDKKKSMKTESTENKKEKEDDKPPFDPPYETKNRATPGKYGKGYSTARHLARITARKAAGMKTEEVEHIDELNKSTLGSYIKKASHDVATKGAMTRQFGVDSRKARDEEEWVEARKKEQMADKTFKKSWKRREGMAKAVDRLTKEEVDSSKTRKADIVRSAYESAKAKKKQKEVSNDKFQADPELTTQIIRND